jgi:hypothetical protein
MIHESRTKEEIITMAVVLELKRVLAAHRGTLARVRISKLLINNKIPPNGGRVTIAKRAISTKCRKIVDDKGRRWWLVKITKEGKGGRRFWHAYFARLPDFTDVEKEGLSGPAAQGLHRGSPHAGNPE